MNELTSFERLAVGQLVMIEPGEFQRVERVAIAGHRGRIGARMALPVPSLYLTVPVAPPADLAGVALSW